MNTAAKIPSTALKTGTRALSTTARRPSSSISSWSGSGMHTRFEKAVSWLQARTTHHPLQPQLQQQLTAALFSTSGMSPRHSSKEEDDLYQALTVSFRTRLKEQIHKPEDEYKAVIEHWSAHTHKDALARQRTRARKDRLAAAIKHKDISWIEKEQERLEMEANGTSDDHFYVIQAWIKCGELKRATMAFERTEAMGVPLTVRILAAMTRAHSRSESLAIAGAMVQKMQDQKLQPASIYDLSALLEYYIKTTPAPAPSSSPISSASSLAAHGSSVSRKLEPSHENVDIIWKVIEPQLQLGISATVNNNASFSYRTYLIYLVDRAQDYERAAELIDKMTVRNISPELERYQKTALTVVQRLSKHGFFTEVQKLLDQKDAALARALPQLAWSDLMEACISRGEDQKARWVYNDMVRYGVQPSSRCKKLFSDLQVKGGTTDRGGPEIAGAGAGSAVAGGPGTSKEKANILSILFNRQPKPALS